MSSEKAADQEKRVTWAELFFDLVFVFAVTQVAALLAADHSPAGAGRALLVFVPLWWAWVGTSICANARNIDETIDRIGMFAVGLCSFLMALAVPGAYGARGLLFAVSYLVLRVLLAALLLRTWRNLALNPFTISMLVSAPLLVVGALAQGGARYGCWIVAALVELANPAVLRRRLVGMAFEPSHLPERFGLFLIIALGESLVAVGAAASGGTLASSVIAAVSVAFVLVCGLWWTYFQFAASAVRHALATTRVQTDIVREVLSYGHFVFVGAIIAIAVGLKYVVKHPVERLHPTELALLAGGCAVYLLTFGYTRWRMFGTISWTRIPAGVACALLGLAALTLPAVLALALLAVAVVALNVIEAVIVRRRA